MHSRPSTPWQRWLRLGLLSLLLAFQGQLLAHEVDHVDHGERSACVLCAHGPGHDTLPALSAPLVLQAPAQAWRVDSAASPLPLCPAPAPGARAPPHA